MKLKINLKYDEGCDPIWEDLEVTEDSVVFSREKCGKNVDEIMRRLMEFVPKRFALHRLVYVSLEEREYTYQSIHNGSPIIDKYYEVTMRWEVRK